MAVFTEVSNQEAQQLIAPLGIGSLERMQGIGAGIENTNYFLWTGRGQWVLTVFERLTFEQLPFYLRLMQHLALRGIPVPLPCADERGQILLSLRGKPAAVVNRLPGAQQLAPLRHHCAQLGAMVARMHIQARDFTLAQPNLRGLHWWEATAPAILPFLTAGQSSMLRRELAYQRELADSPAYAELPRGPVHADLFRDNVMFDGASSSESLTGVFDFYFAGVDTWLFDLSVCLNDWCVDPVSGALDTSRAIALVGAYETVRPLSAIEHRLLPALMRAAALRFWVSRLWDFHLPRQASMLKPHDPAHFERILRARIDQPWHALDA